LLSIHISFILYVKVTLKREDNKAFDEVTGLQVNRDSGYGLEVPHKYYLYGPMTYIH